MSNMNMSINLPLGSFDVKKTRASRPITSLISPERNPFHKLWLKNLAEYTKKDGHNKKGLFVQVSQEYGPHELRKLSRPQQIEMTYALINVVKKIMFSEDYLNPIDLSALAMRCNDNLDLLTFADYSETTAGSYVLDRALGYLPGILDQLIDKNRYDYVLIDLPPFWYAQVHHVIEISGHLLLPYLLDTTNMMCGIFGINRLFMRLRVAGFPIHIGGFLPMFGTKNIMKQKAELAQIETIFGIERMWSSIPPIDTKHRSVEIAYKNNFIDFFEMNNSGHYGLSDKTQREAIKLYNMVDGGPRYTDNLFVEKLGRITAKSKLIEILKHSHGLTESQVVVIRRSLQESMAERIVDGLIDHRSSVTESRILQILEMQILSDRDKILETLVNSTRLSAVQIALAAGLKKAEDVYNRLPEFSLVKHWDLAHCERKIGVKRSPPWN